MDHLYAPWRSEYIKQEIKYDGCVFCYISTSVDKDEELQVLYRDDKCFVVMNKYPYSPGHFMVIPHFHTDKLDTLPTDIWLHLSNLVQKSSTILQQTLNAEGINLGINMGKIAGAGIPDHLHYHLVPRWSGDTNFITTIGNTRVFNTDKFKLYKKLKDNFKNIIL